MRHTELLRRVVSNYSSLFKRPVPLRPRHNLEISFSRVIFHVYEPEP